MKRWSVIAVVFVSISIVGLTVLILAHPKNGGPTSPEAVRSYIETVCYDENHGLPTPPPLHLDDGETLAFGCSNPAA
jgi:hypothetical protein